MAIAVEQLGGTPYKSPSAHEMALEHDIRKLTLTQEGAQLAEERPEVLYSFLQATKAFTRREVDTEIYPFIGKGKISHVHGISEASDVCFKASDNTTQGNRSYYTGMSSAPITSPNLSTEAKLMNSIGKNLAKRDQGIRAPKIYAVAKTHRTQTMLQERISPDFTPLNTAIETLTPEMYAKILTYEATLRKRITHAIGISPLRLGVGDLKVGRRANGGNIFVNDPRNPETTEMYVIDLMGTHFHRAIAARLFGSLH